eukprot:XP_008657270.1 uncharacterized protein LOC103636697 [Zea mays]
MAQDMEDEDHDLEVATYQHRRRRALNERRYAGSIPGRVRIHRDHISGDARIRADYFCAQSVYTDAQFRRRFRMRRHVFERLVLAVQQVDPYFVQRPNCAGELGLSALQKVVAAVRILAYGVPADAVDEYEWRNCPTAWKGMFTGRGKHPTMILEAVASYDLWIWHAYFGMPGSCNDINVLQRSNLFDSHLTGDSPPVTFSVNGHTYNMGYYLADGIYPDWPAFVKTIRHPYDVRTQHFATIQESARKDIEKTFGVLQKRWAIVRGPAYGWSPQHIGDIMKTCIILHNMIVEDEGPSSLNTSFDNIGVLADTSHGSMSERNEFINNRYDQLHDAVKYNQLQVDLIHHHWARLGSGAT